MNPRTIAIGLHVFIAGWMFLNGLGHQAQVLWKYQRGTLRPELDVVPLLLVGTGIIAVAAAFTLSAPALMQGTFWPAYAALAVFAAVIAATAVKYGFRFLGGSIGLATLELAAVTTFALRATP
jgi:hypothetical protein